MSSEIAARISLFDVESKLVRIDMALRAPDTSNLAFNMRSYLVLN